MTVLDAIKNRTSVRNYTDYVVTDAETEQLCRAFIEAPSAVNRQPWHLYVVRDKAVLAKLAEAYNREWFRTARCVMVVCGKHQEAWHRGSDGKDHTDVDVAIATEHLALMAAEMGLGSCWVCNFDVAKVRQTLSIEDEQEEPIVLMPIGKSAEAEPNAHKRKEIGEVVTFV